MEKGTDTQTENIMHQVHKGEGRVKNAQNQFCNFQYLSSRCHHRIQGSHTSSIKARDFFRTKSHVLRTFIVNFTVHLKWKYIIYTQKLVLNNFSGKPVTLNRMILTFWGEFNQLWNLAQAAYRTAWHHKIFENQVLFSESAFNKNNRITVKSLI